MALYKLKVIREKISDETLTCVCSADEAYNLCKKDCESYDREHFLALHLNNRNQLMAIETVAIGTTNRAIVNPKDVFKSALLNNTQAMIFIHNHPSGTIEPSPEDNNLTLKLMRAASLFGISVLDHLIIGDGGYYSYAEQGRIANYEAEILKDNLKYRG